MPAGAGGAALGQLQRALALAGRGGDAGRVRPAAVREVGAAGVLARLAGRGEHGLRLAQAPLGEQSEAAHGVQVVAAQRRRLEVDPQRVELRQRAVRRARARDGDLAPRADQQQLRAQLGIVHGPGVERVDALSGRTARAGGVAHRAAQPHGGVEQGAGPRRRVVRVRQPERLVQLGHRLRTAPELGERGGQLHPDPPVGGPQLAASLR